MSTTRERLLQIFGILKIAQEEAAAFEWEDELDMLEEEGEVDESDEEFDDDERALGLDYPSLEMPPWLCGPVKKLQCLNTKIVSENRRKFTIFLLREIQG